MKHRQLKPLKPLKAVGPIHSKPLHHGEVRAEGTGASMVRLRARGLFYCDVAADLGWSEHRVKCVVGSLERWSDQDLNQRNRHSYHHKEYLDWAQVQLWAYLKAIPETHPSLMIAYYSKADGSHGKQPGTVSFVYYQDKEGRTRYPVDAALSVLNDRYEVIAT